MTKILTTHVGSLPRSQEVVDFIFTRERHEPYDADAFDSCMTKAVSETVRRQVEAGVDIVSDGDRSDDVLKRLDIVAGKQRLNRFGLLRCGLFHESSRLH